MTDWLMLSAIGTIFLGTVSVIVLAFSFHQNKQSIEQNKKALEINKETLRLMTVENRPMFSMDGCEITDYARNVNKDGILEIFIGILIKNVGGETASVHESGITVYEGNYCLGMGDMSSYIVPPGADLYLEIDPEHCFEYTRSTNVDSGHIECFAEIRYKKVEQKDDPDVVEYYDVIELSEEYEKIRKAFMKRE